MVSVTFNSGLSSLPPEFIEFVSFLQTELPTEASGEIEISAIENTDKLHLIDETLMSSSFKEDVPPETKRLELYLSAETKPDVNDLEEAVYELYKTAFPEQTASYSSIDTDTKTESYFIIEQT